MKNASLFFIALFLLVLFSCSPSVDQEKLNSLEVQIIKVDSSLARLRALDTSLILSTLDSLVWKIEYIQNYQTDTIPLETAQLLSNYYGLGKLIEGFSYSSAIEEQLKISKTQFQDLKHDYTQNILKKEEFKKFFLRESKDFEQLKQQILSMEKNWEVFKEKFEQYNPKVDSIVDSIEKKKENLRI